MLGSAQPQDLKIYDANTTFEDDYQKRYPLPKLYKLILQHNIIPLGQCYLNISGKTNGIPFLEMAVNISPKYLEGSYREQNSVEALFTWQPT